MMISVIGIAVEANVLRAAYRSRGRLVVAEHAWDSASPDKAIDALRAEIGKVQGIALSVGLAFLEVAKPELPPLPLADKRRVLLRDADRYFPLEGVLAISAPVASGLTFAMPSEQLQRWVRAFEEWAPVRAIVAAPVSIATVFSTQAANNRSSATLSFLIDAAEGEVGLLRLNSGDVQEARRIPVALAEAAAKSTSQNTTYLSEHSFESTQGKFAAAAGALTLVHGSLPTMLLDPPLERTLRLRRQRREWRSYGALALTLVMLGYAVQSRHTTTLRATKRAVDSLTTVAQPALTAESRLSSLKSEAAMLDSRTVRNSEPLQVLASLSRALPRDAFVQRVEWDGQQWRMDGSVNQASSIVPSLDSSPTFTDVRVLAASTRFRDGVRMRESFSVAFKTKGDTSGRR